MSEVRSASFKVYLNEENFGPEIRRFVVDGDISLPVLRQKLVDLFANRLKGKEFKLRYQFLKQFFVTKCTKKLKKNKLVVL